MNNPMHVINRALFALLLMVSFSARAQKFEGLALTPPMGWNSWNTFASNINEQMVLEMADVMVSSGMRDAGYTYLVLDDAWMAKERDAAGNLVPDPAKFPRGMKYVADYVHSKGLKFGLYNCAGTKTCAGYPGTRGYEYQDARFYASLEIDYLKYDWCNTAGINAPEAYATMSNALKTAGRPIVFSLCEWGDNKPWEWAAPVGHLWRTTGDIYDCFDCVHDHGTWKSWGVMQILDKQDGLRKYAGPGRWNDPDMMEVGNGLSVGENRAHFGMWAMLAAPLIAGNDLRKMTKETQAILTNREVIAVDQDSLGVQGFRYAVKDSVETWLKPLSGGEWAVAFLNRSRSPRTVEMVWGAEVISDTLSKRILDTKASTYKLRDLWLLKEAGTTKKPLKAVVAGHDLLLYRLTSIPSKK
jgi:alpha-galactosidase